MNRTLFAERHPNWFVVIMEVVVIFVYLLAGTIAHFMKLSNLGLYGLANLGLTITAILLLTKKGWWKVVGFRPAEKPGDLLYFIIPILPIFIYLIPGVLITSLVFLLEALVTTLMVGFVEEAFFRGLMLNALKAHGFWRAAIISSILFGLTHVMNLAAGKNVTDQIAQIVYALAFGFAFAALVLKKGILWPLVIAHFLIDFCNFIQKPGFSITPFWNMFIILSEAVIFTAYGVFVMLQREKE